MCLILFSWKAHSDYPLVIAANRDENYRRPTAPADFWEDEPGLLAGRDMEKGGTWMGVSVKGSFAALTNYRNPAESKRERSRGELPLQFLKGSKSPREFMKAIFLEGGEYPGFNLLTGNKEELYYYSNITNSVQHVQPGIHGLSNGLLNSEWPKVSKGKMELERILSMRGLAREKLIEELFDLLTDEQGAPDHQLPQTGVPIEMERMLSPLFIKSAGYGTRCSTILLFGDKDILFVERTYNPEISYEDRVFSIPVSEAERPEIS